MKEFEFFLVHGIDIGYDTKSTSKLKIQLKKIKHIGQYIGNYIRDYISVDIVDMRTKQYDLFFNASLRLTSKNNILWDILAILVYLKQWTNLICIKTRSDIVGKGSLERGCNETFVPP